METRTRGSEAEVDGAIYPSTVTHSGPLMESTSKHSIDPPMVQGSPRCYNIVPYGRRGLAYSLSLGGHAALSVPRGKRCGCSSLDLCTGLSACL